MDSISKTNMGFLSNPAKTIKKALKDPIKAVSKAQEDLHSANADQPPGFKAVAVFRC